MRVYIASPLRATDRHLIANNQGLARLAMAHAIAHGMAPFVPHLLYPQILDPQDPKADQLGITLGVQAMANAQQLWAYLPSEGQRVSAGMHAELSWWMGAADRANPSLWIAHPEVARAWAEARLVRGTEHWCFDMSAVEGEMPGIFWAPPRAGEKRIDARELFTRASLYQAGDGFSFVPQEVEHA